MKGCESPSGGELQPLLRASTPVRFDAPGSHCRRMNELASAREQFVSTVSAPKERKVPSQQCFVVYCTAEGCVQGTCSPEQDALSRAQRRDGAARALN